MNFYFQIPGFSTLCFSIQHILCFFLSTEPTEDFTNTAAEGMGLCREAELIPLNCLCWMKNLVPRGNSLQQG